MDITSPVTITGLSNNTTYQVKLRAVNNAGDGVESVAVTAATAIPPSAPTGLVATRGDRQAKRGGAADQRRIGRHHAGHFPDDGARLPEHSPVRRRCEQG